MPYHTEHHQHKQKLNKLYAARLAQHARICTSLLKIGEDHSCCRCVKLLSLCQGLWKVDDVGEDVVAEGARDVVLQILNWSIAACHQSLHNKPNESNLHTETSVSEFAPVSV